MQAIFDLTSWLIKISGILALSTIAFFAAGVMVSILMGADGDEDD